MFCAHNFIFFFFSFEKKKGLQGIPMAGNITVSGGLPYK